VLEGFGAASKQSKLILKAMLITQSNNLKDRLQNKQIKFDLNLTMVGAIRMPRAFAIVVVHGVPRAILADAILADEIIAISGALLVPRALTLADAIMADAILWLHESPRGLTRWRFLPREFENDVITLFAT